MPMIDVYAPAGAFADKSQLALSVAAAVMVVEKVPDIPMFRENTAVFIHELPMMRSPTSTVGQIMCGFRS